LRFKCFTSRLPVLAPGRHVLAITVKLTQGESDYRYSPVPDARRYGHTQHAGCSWVLNKIPLAARHSEEILEFAVHAYLPDKVEARIEAWTVNQWWHENSRPGADGFYGDAPSSWSEVTEHCRMMLRIPK
jgi:hypothetical protein